MSTPRWITDVAFAAFCLVIAVLRWHVLRHPSSPSGLDSGNWLAFGHGFFGDRVRSSSITYPPLVPLLVTVSSAVLGVARGVASVAVLASLAPGVATYVVLRNY